MVRRQRLIGETIFCALLLLLAGFLFWSAYTISGFSSVASPGSFPMMVAALMLITAAVILTKTVKLPLKIQDDNASARQQFLRQIAPPVVMWIVVAIGLYMVAIEWLGFLQSSFLFLVLTMRLLGQPRWSTILLSSGTSLMAIYLVFELAFSVVLPTGRFWQVWL